MKMFASDNNSGVSPEIMKALEIEAGKYGTPYGDDQTTQTAKEMFYEILGLEPEIYFTTTGTAANIIGLSSMLYPFEAAVAVDSGHINVDECNALERFNGSKVINVPAKNGKLTKEAVLPVLDDIGDRHSTQPRVLYISQITERGTVYTKEEIKELADFAHENNMYLHMDGARISNAVDLLGISLREMVVETGVDVLSFGGTKNGLMMGEAIICFNDKFSRNLKYSMKQGMQLLSKVRFISSQFIAYLSDDLWLRNARNANEMGRYLASQLEEIEGVELVDYQGSNNLFMKLSDENLEKLSRGIDFYISDEETNLIRLITSFDMEKEDIDGLVDLLK